MFTFHVQSDFKNFRMSDQEFLDAYGAAFVKAGTMLLGDTFDIIAVKTGAMRQSLDIDMDRDSHEISVSLGYNGSVHYAIEHEFWYRPFYRNPTTPGTVPHAMQSAAEKISFESVTKAIVDVELAKAFYGSR